MRGIILALALGGALLIGFGWPRQPLIIKPVSITIPDPRITDHEARLKTLEEWAVKRGGKFK